MPLVGGVIGLIWVSIANLLVYSGAHAMLAAAVSSLAPFILAGLLHLDGYMDTCDAVLSRRPLEEKLRILKDPHIGAFAAIMLGILFVLQFAALYAIIDRAARLSPLVSIPVVSRCCAALSILCLKTMQQSVYANMFKQNISTRHIIFVIVITIIAILLSYLFEGFIGLKIVLFVIMGFIVAMSFALKEFHGVSGDLAGFALVVGELSGLIAWALIL
jgi:adenosylcobinamide-GDP ribazoletransferase